eukprot:CAMPEP_0184315844 /NCGR_PEP_ID=MMETSP1049-20130417/86043_1 /TAXON_ID=77928 /ORGANISM="Proteomonas sulcata, Strain CCMP704" /LENGTH=109 /DNA_ID=CAMNT_0026634557 /DNA_START=90 /DNA_END=416 /DNA_ORIENTATION=-
MKDMMKQKDSQADSQKSDIGHFRAVLEEERQKLRELEEAWRGLLSGTHDAKLTYNTQRLSTGKTIIHLTCATVRQAGEGQSSGASTPRRPESISSYDRFQMLRRMQELN